MNVKPVTFSLCDIKIPDKNLTAHLPPANLRASADKLLDKLENGGLIKKAPRLCKYKSKAFFKPKKNQEARLLIDYKASQVNRLIERPTHPPVRRGAAGPTGEARHESLHIRGSDWGLLLLPTGRRPKWRRPNLFPNSPWEICFLRFANGMHGFPGLSGGYIN